MTRTPEQEYARVRKEYPPTPPWAWALFAIGIGLLFVFLGNEAWSVVLVMIVLVVGTEIIRWQMRRTARRYMMSAALDDAEHVIARGPTDSSRGAG